MFRNNYAVIKEMMPVILDGWLVVSKRLDHGSIHPTKLLRALAGTPAGRDDTVYSLVWFVSGEPFHHSAFKYLRFLSSPICVNYLSTFKYPADLVDPVIRVLSLFTITTTPSFAGS